MATSGSTDFNLTALEVVESAFSKVGVKAAEQDLEAPQIKDGMRSLNLMMKMWQSQGLHLWAKQEGVLFLDAGKTDYLLGPTGDEATTLDDFIGTTTTGDEAALAVVIGVTDSTGMTAADSVGIKLDSGVRHWTTIVSVDSSVQITITTGIPTVAAEGASVFTYTTILERPLRVLSSRRKTYGEDNEIAVNSWSRDEYFNQVNKTSQGTVVNAYYSPQLGNGRYYVWQTASDANQLVRFTYERAFEDVEVNADNLDFPAEWLEPIIYNLAARLTDDYKTPPQRAQNILVKAVALLEDVTQWDEEMESINIQPDFS